MCQWRLACLLFALGPKYFINEGPVMDRFILLPMYSCACVIEYCPNLPHRGDAHVLRQSHCYMTLMYACTAES